MTILFVTPPPSLPSRLNRIRTFDLIRIMANRHKIHLLAVTTETKVPREFSEMKSLCASISIIRIKKIKSYFNALFHPLFPSEVGYCISGQVRRALWQKVLEKDIDLVYIKRLRGAVYLSDLIPVPVIVDTTDAMSLFYHQMFRLGSVLKKPFYFLEYLRYKYFEKKMMQKWKRWVVCSNEDREYLLTIKQDHKTIIDVIPNPVDTSYFTSVLLHSTQRRKSQTLIFRGLMDKPVNIDAAQFLVKEIFPLIVKIIPNITLLIVGPRPVASVRRLAARNIRVLGYVSDLNKLYAKTSVAVCPIRIGTGSRHKILQSWAYGIPVVSTTQGARGLFARDQENLLIANTPLAFAQAVIKLLGDEMLYNRLAENGRKTVEKLYSFPAVDRLIQKTLRSTQNHLDNCVS